MVMTPVKTPSRWWLILDDDVEVVRSALEVFEKHNPVLAGYAKHILDTGLNVSDTPPADFEDQDVSSETRSG